MGYETKYINEIKFVVSVISNDTHEDYIVEMITEDDNRIQLYWSIDYDEARMFADYCYAKELIAYVEADDRMKQWEKDSEYIAFMK